MLHIVWLLTVMQRAGCEKPDYMQHLFIPTIFSIVAKIAKICRVKYPNLGTFVYVLYFALPNFLHNIY